MLTESADFQNQNGNFGITLFWLYTQVEKGHDTLYFIFLNTYFGIPLVSFVLVFYTLSIGLRGCPRSLEATIEYYRFCFFPQFKL